MKRPTRIHDRKTKSDVEFASRIALLKAEAGKRGLWKTMHALEAGVKAVGWEIAEQQEKRRTG